jgi:hypothetical protein
MKSFTKMDPTRLQEHVLSTYIESAAIMAFGWYWLAKSSELRRSSAIRKATRGDMAI